MGYKWEFPVAHLLLLFIATGGAFHKPLQFANYCTFLTFPHDFFTE